MSKKRPWRKSTKKGRERKSKKRRKDKKEKKSQKSKSRKLIHIQAPLDTPEQVPTIETLKAYFTSNPTATEPPPGLVDQILSNMSEKQQKGFTDKMIDLIRRDDPSVTPVLIKTTKSLLNKM
jgi:hypothetical protein